MTSVQVDSFIRERLPPSEQQPEFRFDLPELRYPERLNAAVELIDRGDPLAPGPDTESYPYLIAH